MGRLLRSSLRRYVKGLRWRGDISRPGLASALKRARQERDRVYLSPPRHRPELELGW
jgi:hypothetical protein